MKNLSVKAAVHFVTLVVSRPLWLYRIFKGSKDMAIYHVTFGKNTTVKVLLAKSVAKDVMDDRALHQGALQYVWMQTREEVAIDPNTYAGIKVPDLRVWRNLDRDGNYVVRVEYHRDASASERKMAHPANLLREVVSAYLHALLRTTV